MDTKLRGSGAFAAALTALGLVGQALAGDTIIGAKDGAGPVNSPDKKYTVAVTPATVQYLRGPSDADMKALKDAYGTNWKFNTGTAPDGTFNILQYSPFAQEEEGGAEFSVLFDDKKGDKPTNYLWVQIANPSHWGTDSKSNKIHVDSKYNNFPFCSDYTPDDLSTAMTPTSFEDKSAIWNDEKDYPQQNIQNPAGGGKVPAGNLILVDEPYLTYDPAVVKYGTVQDIFDLLLVQFTWNGKFDSDAGGTVTILDGMQWGVKIATVPEPSSLVMASTAVLVGLGLAWRCRRRTPAA